MALIYAYGCPNCGPIDSFTRADAIDCERCGARARRCYRIGVIESSLKSRARYDPVVGQYVANDAEFASVLAAQAERESASLGMEVKLATVDARDTEGLAELHGHSVDTRKADLEATAAAAHAKANI